MDKSTVGQSFVESVIEAGATLRPTAIGNRVTPVTTPGESAMTPDVPVVSPILTAGDTGKEIDQIMVTEAQFQAYTETVRTLHLQGTSRKEMDRILAATHHEAFCSNLQAQCELGHGIEGCQRDLEMQLVLTEHCGSTADIEALKREREEFCRYQHSYCTPAEQAISYCADIYQYECTILSGVIDVAPLGEDVAAYTAADSGNEEVAAMAIEYTPVDTREQSQFCEFAIQAVRECLVTADPQLPEHETCHDEVWAIMNLCTCNQLQYELDECEEYAAQTHNDPDRYCQFERRLQSLTECRMTCHEARDAYADCDYYQDLAMLDDIDVCAEEKARMNAACAKLVELNDEVLPDMLASLPVARQNLLFCEGPFFLGDYGNERDMIGFAIDTWAESEARAAAAYLDHVWQEFTPIVESTAYLGQITRIQQRPWIETRGDLIARVDAYLAVQNMLARYTVEQGISPLDLQTLLVGIDAELLARFLDRSSVCEPKPGESDFAWIVNPNELIVLEQGMAEVADTLIAELWHVIDSRQRRQADSSIDESMDDLPF